MESPRSHSPPAREIPVLIDRRLSLTCDLDPLTSFNRSEGSQRHHCSPFHVEHTEDVSPPLFGARHRLCGGQETSKGFATLLRGTHPHHWSESLMFSRRRRPTSTNRIAMQLAKGKYHPLYAPARALR